MIPPPQTHKPINRGGTENKTGIKRGKTEGKRKKKSGEKVENSY